MVLYRPEGCCSCSVRRVAAHYLERAAPEGVSGASDRGGSSIEKWLSAGDLFRDSALLRSLAVFYASSFPTNCSAAQSLAPTTELWSVCQVKGGGASLACFGSFRLFRTTAHQRKLVALSGIERRDHAQNQECAQPQLMPCCLWRVVARSLRPSLLTARTAAYNQPPNRHHSPWFRRFWMIPCAYTRRLS